MTTPTFSVDWADVVLPILRDRLGSSYLVGNVLPDQVVDKLPLVVVRQTGGSSPAPAFYDTPFLNITNWSAQPSTKDAVRAARDDADLVRRALWEAWRAQTTVPAGHLSRVRESQGPMQINDPDLPHIGCFSATYEIRVRRADSA